MKKILFATDFSENAKKAFSYAVKIAQEYEAQLIMLHIFDTPMLWNFAEKDDVFEMEKNAVKESLDELKKWYNLYGNAEMNVRFIAEGNITAVNGIISVIKRMNPTLVVIGAKGESTIKEVIIGSTSRALVKKSPVPILSVPQDAIFQNLKKVLYASDFQDEDVLALQQVNDLFQPNDYEITVAHLSTQKDHKDAEKLTGLKDVVTKNTTLKAIKFELVPSDPDFEGLNEYIDKNHFNLIVMLEKERKGIFDRIFHRDFIQKMEYHTTTPLLTFNEYYLKFYNKRHERLAYENGSK